MSRDTAVIRADKLHWRAGGREILHAVSLQLREGEILGVIGPNGAGKSSLLKLLARVTKPLSGELALSGQLYPKVSPRAFAARLGYLEQNAQVHWPLRVAKVVELGRLPYRGVFRRQGEEDSRAIGEAIALCGIAPLLERVITTLSEGEKMLVSLARLLAARPRVLIADEPVAALDPYHQLLILETLRVLAARQPRCCAAIVLHDLSLAAQFCDRLLLLHQGRVAAAGTPAEVLNAANLARCYRIRADIQFDGARPVITSLDRIPPP